MPQKKNYPNPDRKKVNPDKMPGYEKVQTVRFNKPLPPGPRVK